MLVGHSCSRQLQAVCRLSNERGPPKPALLIRKNCLHRHLSSVHRSHAGCLQQPGRCHPRFSPVQRKTWCKAEAASVQLGTRLQPLLRWAAEKLPVLRYSDIIKRIALTILMLFVIRSGAFIPLPGVDTQKLPAFNLPSTQGEAMVRALYGQASELPASLFNLGIGPFINASIFIMVLITLTPATVEWQWLQRMKDARKEGKGGEAYINKWVYSLALAFAIYAGLVEAYNLAPYALFTQWFVARTAVALVAGTCIIHACADVVTAYGIGNGTTLVICASIITGYASTLHSLLAALEASVVAPWKLAFLGFGFLGLLLVVVVMNLTELRLPIVTYSNTMPEVGGRNAGQSLLLIQARVLAEKKAAERGRQGAFLPIMLTSSGMMPVIFASAFYFGLLPLLVRELGLHALLTGLVDWQSSATGLLLYGLMVFACEFLPFGNLKPPEVAEYFNQISVGIKGWAPGQITESNLARELRRVKMWGGMLLAFVAVAAYQMDVLATAWLGTPLGATNLLIIVGAVLQATRQVQSLMEGPNLQAKLDNERRVIQSLSSLAT